MTTQKFLLTLLALMAITPGVFSQDWQLVWADEFDNGISDDWVFETGNGPDGWGNQELQYYRRENATVENGELIITAKKESIGGYNYTSTRMKTQGRKSWKYGRMEARISFPSVSGLWPSFWMLGEKISTVGWPACGEIDVVEVINTSPTVYGTMHWDDGGHASNGGSTPGGDKTGYHVYSVEWDANQIKWFLDGQQYHVADIGNGINGTSELHDNFFVLLNMAVGGSWPGYNIDDSSLPATMRVDYVRVYQRDGGGDDDDDPVDFTRFIEAESYNAMAGMDVEACSEGGQNVGWIDAGDWLSYHNITFPNTGTYLVEYRVASLNGGGRLSLDMNAGTIVLGELDVPNTGGWQNWTTISHTVTITAGTYNLGIYAIAGGWNLNWIRVTAQTAASAAMAEQADQSIVVSPNPTSGMVTLKDTEAFESGQVTILNKDGREVWRSEFTGAPIDVSRLPADTYIIRISKDGRQVTKRFIKE